MKSTPYTKCGNGLWAFVLLVFSVHLSVAQVTFTQAPENLQLYPRNAQNKAVVVISGKLLRKTYQRAILEVSEEKKLARTFYADFSATDSASFTFRAEIVAQPVEYAFRVVLEDSRQNKETVLERTGVVCGDFLVLYGQSNLKAGAGVDQVEKETDTRLLRNYDFRTGTTSLQWLPAHQPHGSVGVIGLHLQSLILARYGIPTCVINGSVGGANLLSLIRPDGSAPNSSYNRLYTRIQKAGALGNVKAIVWRQGEAETCNWYPDIRDYPDNFAKLYRQLSGDYPGFTRFYNIQTGIQYCNQLEEAGELREYMRATKYLFDRVETTNMHALPLSDDVHYSMEGYKKAAEELLPLLGRDLYGDSDSLEVHPPDIQKIVITPSRDTLILVFEEDQKMTYPESLVTDGFTWKMEDYLYVNTTTAFTDDIVEKGWADRNRVYLKLKWGIKEGYVTYLPSYSRFNPPVQGVHLTNSRGLRAMSFYQMPVRDALEKPEIISGEIREDARIKLVFMEPGPYLLERRLAHEQAFRSLAPVTSATYEDTLSSPYFGTVEYRLKRVSEESESAYSDILRITGPDPLLGGSREIRESVYPNPFGSESVFLQSGAQVKTITAISGSGKRTPLSFERNGAEKYRVHTQNLASGTYLLRVKTETEVRILRAVKL